jgi:hypothetical protein
MRDELPRRIVAPQKTLKEKNSQRKRPADSPAFA